MARSLRPRPSRPSYSELAGYRAEGDEDEALSLTPLEDLDSGDEFVPNDPVQGVAVDNGGTDEGRFTEVEEQQKLRAVLSKRARVTHVGVTSHSLAKSAQANAGKTAKNTTHSPAAPMSSNANFSAMSGSTRTAKMYALPNPNPNHRHRAIPAYLRREHVERLDAEPVLFGHAKIVMTNSMSFNQRVTDRVSKAWGYNVGPGPVWQILEDRSCFKEADESQRPDAGSEAARRPRVHTTVEVGSGWEILSAAYALNPLNNIEGLSRCI